MTVTHPERSEGVEDMKLYKIGQLAQLAGLSSRTVDYYTTIGLIRPETRSDTNYRLYSDETLKKLKRIEIMKKEKYTLEEIKSSFDQWNKVSEDGKVTEKLANLEIHLQQLEKDVQELQPIIEKMKPAQAKNTFKRLTPHTAALIEMVIILMGGMD